MHGASDVHLVRGVAPVLRVNGEIVVSQGRPLDETTLRAWLLRSSRPSSRRSSRKHGRPVSRNNGRASAASGSVYQHAGCPEVALRLCETVVRTSQELELPPIVEELTRLPNGLILVTGPTGQGKTTTLNFMIDVINRERRCKIVTIEDPVELSTRTSAAL